MGLVALGLAGCVADDAPPAPPAKAVAETPKPAAPALTKDQVDFLNMMAPGRAQGAALDRQIADAGKRPLGSKDNPVRADNPDGQHAYLRRLRCSDGKAPAYQRNGNLGAGIYKSIVDLYVVTCGGAQPARTEVIMDMYFPGHVEQQPVPGFTIVK
jgi:hypothetical protein